MDTAASILNTKFEKLEHENASLKEQIKQKDATIAALTRRLDQKSTGGDDAANDMASELAKAELRTASQADSAKTELPPMENLEQELPTLKAWLYKDSPARLKGWQRRYVAVLGFNIFYSKQYVPAGSAQEAVDHEMNFIAMNVIKSIHKAPVHPTKNPERVIFEIEAKQYRADGSWFMRTYRFKADNPVQCVKWVEGLNQYFQRLQNLLSSDSVTITRLSKA